MSKNILSITMSLDGFIAGPNISKEFPLGENGLLLHQWIFDDSTDTDKKIITDLLDNTGAVIVGGSTYNTAIEDAWEIKSPFDAPAFVLTSKEPVMRVSGFEFIHNGIEDALLNAKAAAKEKNVWIMGGANIAQQYLLADLVDELQIHIAPILLGKGTLLFSSEGFQKKLIKTNSIETKGASHLFYNVVK